MSEEMKIITINLNEPSLKFLQALEDAGFIESRSDGIRRALIEFLQGELELSDKLKEKFLTELLGLDKLSKLPRLTTKKKQKKPVLNKNDNIKKQKATLEEEEVLLNSSIHIIDGKKVRLNEWGTITKSKTPKSRTTEFFRGDKKFPKERQPISNKPINQCLINEETTHKTEG